ncbi:4-phosphopantetheinyl transferase [Streptomyces sp. ODS05-4]|uniref:4'-phosphopantetheinyl transferase family protein n=1 Tax=Streptomyces sp. ODS05-4 TaxID=2944939 RepID=UPI00210958EF|nr:4-phosphopantetheinyl transferase [Streptomyces sp. ODS05-4]
MTALAVVARTAEVLGHPDLTEALLAPWEHARLARVRRPDRRDDVLAARLLLRWCAARATGRPPAEMTPHQHCDDCGRFGHGRPSLPAAPLTGISVSHADGLVAAAAGPGPIGVDVERADRRPPPPAHLARRFPAEPPARPGPDALTAWVRAEARFKAGGPLPVRTWTDPDRRALAAVATAAPVRLLTCLS